MFKHLFQPITIGKLKIKNRLFMAPTQTFTNTADGFPTDLTFEQYEARCSGGWGLVAGEATCIRPDGRPYDGFACLYSEEHARALGKIADIMHKHGLPACIQFMHAGRVAQKVITGLTPVAPSAPLPVGGVVDWPPDGSNKPHALTGEEVEQLINDFVLAVVRAKRVGFDMALLHGAHGFIFNNFQAHYTNHRTDKWGEPTAFAVEVIKRAREAVGPDFAIGMRVNGDDFFPGGITLHQSQQMVPRFVEAGLDWVDVSAGTRERNFWMVQPLYMPGGCLVHLAAGIKEVCKVPVVTAGRINDPRIAEHVLATGKADIVSVSRAQIADPDFLVKAREGRIEDIRRCTGCDLCMSTVSNVSEIIKCAVNFEMGRRISETEIRPARTPKKIMVVGGGVAGMEFARVASLRGHKVTLYDKESKLGGTIASVASRIPRLNNRDLLNSVAYLSSQMKMQRIQVVLSKRVTPEFVQEQNPDAVVLATGSVAAAPQIPGINGKNVIMLDDYLRKRPGVGPRVVVLGGGHGWETAVSLARENKDTTVVEESSEIGDAPYITRMRKPVLALFSREAKLNILTSTRVHEITDCGVVVTSKEGKAHLLAADTVIIALNRLPDNHLRKELEGKLKEVYSIGDCVKPSQTMEAIHSASRLAREV